MVNMMSRKYKRDMIAESSSIYTADTENDFSR